MREKEEVQVNSGATIGNRSIPCLFPYLLEITVRPLTTLTLTLAMMGLAGCGTSSYCPDCNKTTPITSVTYQPATSYTAGANVTLTSPVVAGGSVTQYQVTSGDLPTGLTLDPVSGAITGTPSVPGVYTITVLASNGANAVSTNFVLTVVPAQGLTLSYPTPATFGVASAMTPQAPTLGNATPGLGTTYAVTAGALPDGILLEASTGILSGNPTALGASTFTVTATNGARSATADLTYTITPLGTLTLSYPLPATLLVNSAISLAPTVGYPTPGLTTTFALASGALPTGVTLNPDGSLNGTPTLAGVFSCTIEATNGTRTVSTPLTFTITPVSALTLAYAMPTPLTVGQAFTTLNAALGNATPGVSTTYARISGALPGGIALNTDGSLSGQPTASGVFGFTIQATNGTRTATCVISVTVIPAGALGLTYTTPVTFPPNVLITPQVPLVVNATTGIATSFSLTAGALPDGLVLNSDGSISGTPTVINAFSCTIQATNGTRTASIVLNYTVQFVAPTALGYTSPATYTEQSTITPSLPNPTGGAPTSYSVVLGTLPAGLLLDGTTGAITGMPTTPTAGAVSVTIRGTNSIGHADQIVSLTVAPAVPTALGYASPVNYTNGTLITPNAPHPTGGTPYSYQIISGVLPAGLSIDPTTGIVSGTPSAGTSGAVLVTVRGTNGAGSMTQVISFTVADVAPTGLSYTTPTTYTDGTPIQVNNPNPTGGTPNLYAVTIGTLPAGLVLNPSTGVISGTPTAPTGGPVSLTIQGGNGLGSVTKTISITVAAAAPTALHYTTPVSYLLNSLISPNLPNPVGGTPTGYSITGGALPTGLNLDPSTGQITGTPTANTAGAQSVTIKAVNASLPAGITQTVNIDVPLPIVVAFAANPTILPVGQKAQLTGLFNGGIGTVDNGIGVIPTGGSVNTPAVSSPQTIIYTLSVTNGTPAQDVTATATVQWVTPVLSLTAPVSLAGGGGIDYTAASHSGDPFYGFKIAIPSQDSVCQDTTLTIIQESVPPAAVPAPALQVSQIFNITTDIGYPFKKPATVTLPYDTSSLSAGDVPVPFYWDPSYGQWVANGIKNFDPVAKEVTFTTLLPGRYMVMAIPSLATSLATTTVGFTYNVDGWFQPNQGVFDLPGGSSFGMSAFASWYFRDRKSNNSSTGLYSLFRQGPIASDDVSAKALISRLANGTMESWSGIVDQSTYQLTDNQTGLALITALKVTGQPQIFLMGDARPVQSNALAAVLHSYDNTTKKFHLMDPNYPGTDLTITWDPAATTNGWTAYDRAIGYFPTFTQYAMEGHTSIHRLVDYERAFQGANTYFPDPPYATITPAHVGNLVSPVFNGTTLQVADASSVTIDGSIVNGDETATHIYWSQNGNARTAVPLSGTNFTFSVGALEDPYGTRIMLETTPNPCDPTFSHSGFLEFIVKDQALKAWFTNSCFEQGLQGDGYTPTGWITEQGSNLSVMYPATATWNAQGVMNSYAPSFTAPSTGSALVGVGNDPTCTTTPLPKVLDGTAAFRVNHIGSGANISRAYQVVTVPTSVAHPQLSFYWSAVLENAGHVPAQQPYADILIQDVTDPLNVAKVYYFHVAAQDPTYPGWQTNGGWGAIPWQKVSLPDLTTLKGHKLKITVTAADCTQSGHGGYVYLDNLACN